MKIDLVCRYSKITTMSKQVNQGMKDNPCQVFLAIKLNVLAEKIV
jgi:hypothetical protein